MAFIVTGIIGALGFTSTGIAGGSIAAGMMSMAATFGGGGVASMAAGGIIATLQSIGAAGLGVAATWTLNALFATAGGAAIYKFMRRGGDVNELMNCDKCQINEKEDTIVFCDIHAPEGEDENDIHDDEVQNCTECKLVKDGKKYWFDFCDKHKPEPKNN